MGEFKKEAGPIAEEVVNQSFEWLGDKEKIDIKTVASKISQLRVEFQNLKENGNLVIKTQKLATSGIRKYLGTSYYRTNNTQKAKNEKEFGQAIFNCYFLTEEILSSLKLINKIDYKIYSNNTTGTQFIEAGTKEDLVYNDTVFLTQLKDGTYRLRLNAEVFKEKIAKLNENEKIIATQAQTHYQDFVKVLRFRYEKGKFGRRNKHNPSKGYLAEAFTRHQEQINHFNKNDKYVVPSEEFNTPESRARVWEEYFQSKGTVAYYYGPDTAKTQVKTINASLVSDVDTVISTTQAILKLFDRAEITETTIRESVINNKLVEFFKSPIGEVNIKKAIEKNLDATERIVDEQVRNILNSIK